MTKRPRIVAVAVAAGWTLALPAFAQTTWDMATPYPDAEFHTQNVRLFVEDVAEATDGELQITVHSGQSLFKHPEIKRSVQNQLVPIGEVLMANLFNEDPIFGADNIPFVATDYDSAEALWETQRPMVEERLADDGIILLYTVPWPGQGFYTNDEIASVEDLNNASFRTYNATTSRMAELLGAVPTTVEAVEIPQAFSTGVVEAMVTSAATGVRTKAWDFTNHFYDLYAWLPKNMVIVNERAFQALPEDQQTAILEAAAAAEERGWQMSQEVSASTVEELGQNMTVHEADDALRTELEAIGQTMAAEWAEQTGEDGQRILDSIN